MSRHSRTNLTEETKNLLRLEHETTARQLNCFPVTWPRNTGHIILKEELSFLCAISFSYWPCLNKRASSPPVYQCRESMHATQSPLK